MKIHPNYIFPHYILFLFLHCILPSKEILLIHKITAQMAKNTLQFLKKHICMQQGESLPTLGMIIVKKISNNNSNADIEVTCSKYSDVKQITC